MFDGTMEIENKISLVVDREYGSKPESLVASGSVWIVDTETNRQAALDYWQSVRGDSPAVVTTFKALPTESALEMCSKTLPMLDLHHGEYAGVFSVLDVIGIELNEELRAAVEALGFSKFESIAEGFRASRQASAGKQEHSIRRTWTIIAVGDVTASFKWYQSLLALPPTAPAHDYFGQIVDSDGTVLLCLHEWGAHDHPSLMSPDHAQPGNGLLLFFRVDDFDLILRRARELVTRFEEEPHVNPSTGTSEFSLRDPDGYYVTISAL